MLFRRRDRLKREYDELLNAQLQQLKTEWMTKKSLMEKSFDVSDEFIAEAKLAEAKYFFLFKELREREKRLKGE